MTITDLLEKIKDYDLDAEIIITWEGVKVRHLDIELIDGVVVIDANKYY